MTSRTKIGIGCGIGCLFIGILSLFLTGGAFFKIIGLLKDPEGIEIMVNAPLKTKKGEEFILEVHIENTSSQERLLQDIDLASEYLVGIAIQRTDPPFVQSMHIPLVNIQSYEFEKPLSPKKKVVVRFYAMGLKPGDFAGDVDVYIDSETSFLTYPIRTLVEE